MAPATKRRKLRHDDSSDSDLSRDDNNDSIASMHDTDGSEVGMSLSDGEPGRKEEEEEDDDTRSAARDTQKKQETALKPSQAKLAHKRQEVRLHDGVYTAEVYKSNLFKLQVDELLQQVKLKYGKREAPAENALRTLKNVIEQLPPRAPVSVPEAESSLHAEGIAVPFPGPRPPKDAKYKLQFDRPSSINATGSYPLRTATRSDDSLAIDLVVTMPNSLFQEKDYLNYRYFYRRAYYLACLAAGIQNCQDHRFQVDYDSLNGNHLQPIIVVRPYENGGADDFSSSKCIIRILLSAPEKTFPEGKLRPNSSSLRSQVSKDDESKSTTPTPFYNATIQSDTAITPYLKLLHAASGKCDAFKDACVLGRIWLRQRGFGSRLSKGGFGNFEWAALMAILLQPNPGAGSPPLLPGYSSYQLFKATLQFLVKHNLSKTPYMFQARDVVLSKHDLTPMLFDGPRNMNLLFKMTPWAYSHLQQEASLTIDTLGDSLAESFESTFIQKADLLMYQKDAILKIPLSAFSFDPTSETYEQLVTEQGQKLYNTLTRALADRITGLTISLPDTHEWKVDSPKSPPDQQTSILIGIGAHATNASRTVDHGPAAENKKEAASFRQFWGEKAELRRFKDGSILESVVWSTQESSLSVMEQIVRFVLQKHLGARVAQSATFHMDTFAPLVTIGRIRGQAGTAAFLARMGAFATLEKDIRSLEEMPLQIRHISAADALLRYSATDVETLRRPASITVQFEGSARWPEDLSAIQRTKIAFLLKFSDLLGEEKPVYITRIGLENPSQPSQNQGYLDIILPSSFSFRLRIHHEREASLLDRQLRDKSLDGQSREAAAAALAVYKREYLHIPAHTRALQTLCTRYPTLSQSIQLTKRWFESHLLSHHFSVEFIELLVVRTFLQPYPWSAPSTATAGFLRTIQWLSRWDWRHTPLIVDLSSSLHASGVNEIEGVSTGSLKPEDIESIRTRFEAWRRIDPSMNRVVLFAATNLDTDGTTWTDRGQPEKVVAARMTALARAATNAVRASEDKMLSHASGQQKDSPQEPDHLDPASLFVSQLQDYDIIVRLSSKFSSTGKKKAGPKFKNLEAHQDSKTASLQIGYDPAALFAQDLCSVYGDAVLWFWNPDALDVIAGLWNPAVTGQRTWKVKPGWNSVPVKGKNSKDKADGGDGVDIQLNKGAICNEIKRLGGDMVAGIEVHR